jgi:hypothetical protein
LELSWVLSYDTFYIQWLYLQSVFGSAESKINEWMNEWMCLIPNFWSTGSVGVCKMYLQFNNSGTQSIRLTEISLVMIRVHTTMV